MAETAAKRLKISPITIGTHSGHFHADEALAVSRIIALSLAPFEPPLPPGLNVGIMCLAA
jgi:hypothetical protein